MKSISFGAMLMLLIAALCTGFHWVPRPQLRQQLAAAQLLLTPPTGWKETPVIHNEMAEYDYALRYPGRQLEIRYAISPLAGTKPVRGNQDKSHTKSDDNRRYAESFRAIIFRINAGNPTKPSGMAHLDAGYSLPLKVLSAEAAQVEYGADWVEMSPVEPGRKFGQDYKHCVVVGLFKKGIANAYYFYLFDNQRDFDEIILNDAQKVIFHSLRFQ